MNKLKLTCLLVLAVTVAGCGDPKVLPTSSTVVSNTPIADLREVNIQGCQYLVVENMRPNYQQYAISLTHKGNCTNHTIR